jgi:peptidyl-prolyl cis-trans isomerase A (cyclophilin A)
MARLADPDSASAQFFINVADNGSLDYPRASGSGYAVFGKVVSGMDVVDKIAAVRTTRRGPFSDVPMQAVVITKATVQ